MDFLHCILNLVAPIATLNALLFLTPIYVLFKVVRYLARSISMEDVAGKVVLIVGASSGIGEKLTCDRWINVSLGKSTRTQGFQIDFVFKMKHVAYEYARRGACLVVAARREKSLREVANTAILLGAPDAIAVPADVSTIDDCKRLINETINHFGRLNHLVNCAGVTPVCMLEETTDITKLRAVTDINFWGYVYTTYLSVPHLRRSNGKIVVIGSSASWLPAPRMSLYNASKAAVVSFYETLRLELGSEVGITIVAPGLTESEMTKGKFMNKDGEMVVDQELRDAEMSIVPVEFVAESAMAIVNSACRGDSYLVEPYWMKTTAYWVTFFPEIFEWFNSWFLGVEPGASPRDAPSKKVLDVTGLKYVLYPASIRSPEIKP